MTREETGEAEGRTYSFRGGNGKRVTLIGTWRRLPRAAVMDKKFTFSCHTLGGSRLRHEKLETSNSMCFLRISPNVCSFLSKLGSSSTPWDLDSSVEPRWNFMGEIRGDISRNKNTPYPRVGKWTRLLKAFFHCIICSHATYQ